MNADQKDCQNRRNCQKWKLKARAMDKESGDRRHRAPESQGSSVFKSCIFRLQIRFVFAIVGLVFQPGAAPEDGF
jgi:hypothetical protein